MDHPLTILGIAGSLREASYNRALLRTAQGLSPEGTGIEIFDLAGIPLFNQDQEANPPRIVIEFRERIRFADAILIATPEYNHGVPGVLKNAIDWGSRPPGKSAWNDKPVALMGATPGTGGTIRAQAQLRTSLVAVNLHPVNRPFVNIAGAAQKFDAQGNLTDEPTKGLVKSLLDALVALTRRLAPR